jgi:uncharacterized protein YndB with AHSA1/START domain
MDTNLTARATTAITMPRRDVWNALVDPAAIQSYMFGTTVISDWQQGSPIVWKGEWKGSSYEDKGVILRIEPERLLQYSHFSPLSGQEDRPENYHTVTIELAEADGQTSVSLAQDKNATEEARAEAEANWQAMLAALKAYLEREH